MAARFQIDLPLTRVGLIGATNEQEKEDAASGASATIQDNGDSQKVAQESSASISQSSWSQRFGKCCCGCMGSCCFWLVTVWLLLMLLTFYPINGITDLPMFMRGWIWLSGAHHTPAWQDMAQPPPPAPPSF